MLLVLSLLAIVREHLSVVAPRQAERHQVSPAAAATTLRTWSTAVQARDAPALRALAPTGDHVARAQLAAVAENARLLDLTHVSARFIARIGTVAADGSWTGAVELTWRIGDLDPSPARAEVLFGFAPRGDRLAITRMGPNSTMAGSTRSGRRTPLWLRGVLSVVATPRAVVLVDGTPERAEQVARRIDRGLTAVRQVSPTSDHQVIVEVPSSAADLNETLGAAAGTYDTIAAVTATVDGSTRRRAPVHIFLNPDVKVAMRGEGADLVMRHELVHIATGAALSPIEPWLAEGFADYVALRDVALPDATTMDNAIAVTRRDGVPTALPGSSRFASGAADLQASYEQARLACRIIVEHVGERGLRAVHRAASAGMPVDQALHRVGLEQVDVVKEWRGRLQDLAG